MWCPDLDQLERTTRKKPPCMIPGTNADTSAQDRSEEPKDTVWTQVRSTKTADLVQNRRPRQDSGTRGKPTIPYRKEKRKRTEKNPVSAWVLLFDADGTFCRFSSPLVNDNQPCAARPIPGKPTRSGSMGSWKPAQSRPPRASGKAKAASQKALSCIRSRPLRL